MLKARARDALIAADILDSSNSEATPEAQPLMLQIVFYSHFANPPTNTPIGLQLLVPVLSVPRKVDTYARSEI